MLVNLELYHRPYPAEEIEAANWEQWFVDAACRARNEDTIIDSLVVQGAKPPRAVLDTGRAQPLEF